MRTIKEIVRYTIKFDKKIKKICSPLNDYLNIPIFTYYKIHQNGTIVTISNFTEQMEFYYEEGLYLSNPYLVSPALIKSGCVMTATTPDPDYQKTIDLSRQRFNMTNTFLIIQKENEFCEGFLFGNNAKATKQTNYLEHIFLLKKFTQYFKSEAACILNKIELEKFNLIEAKGDAFFKRSLSAPLSYSPSTEKFLHSLTPLSKREQECLNLYLQGRSAQSSAAILNLSKRTVEHYFENIMMKLGCSCKSELHERFYSQN